MVSSLPVSSQLTGKEDPCEVMVIPYFDSAASAFLVAVSKKKVSCLKQAPVDLKSELALPKPSRLIPISFLSVH